MRRLLLDRSVGAYFFSKLGASIGIWIHNVVAAVMVFELTRSAFLVGAVSIAQFTPQVLLTPWAGALADRGNRRLQVVIGRFVAGVGAGGLALWFAIVDANARTAWPILAAALVVGIGFAIAVPAAHALLPALGREGELPAVVAVDATPFTIARAVGPALGALLLTLGGPAVAFGVVAVTQTGMAVVVWWLPLRGVAPPVPKDGSVLAAVRHLRADPAVAFLLLAVLGIGLGVDPVITLTPPLADALGGGTQLVAMMASSFGIGAATAPLLIGLVRRVLAERMIGFTGLVLLQASLVGMAMSASPGPALAALFVGGIGMLFGVSSYATQVQERIPDVLRGRIMALWVVCFVGSRPLAAAINGTLADVLSVRAALLVLTVLLVGIAVVARPGRVAAIPPAIVSDAGRPRYSLGRPAGGR